MASYVDQSDNSGTTSTENTPITSAESVSVKKYITPTHEETSLCAELKARLRGTEMYKNKHKEFDFTDMTYLRFLRAHKHKLDKTVDKMVLNLEFRATNNVESISEACYPNILALPEGPSLLHEGEDADGRPLLVVHAKIHDKNNRDITEYEKYVIHIFEKCMAYGRDERLSFIFYLEDFSVWKNMDYEVIKLLVGILQSQYPETLHRALIVDAPWVFNACWVIIKPWLDPITASKVKFITMDELNDLIHLPSPESA
jgi:hypothetical protein